MLHAPSLYVCALLLTTVCWSQDAPPGSPLVKGMKVPAFSLPDQNGKVRSLADISGPAGAMIVFYRSADWCPFCKSQLVELNESQERLKKRRLGVAAISYDSVAVLKNFSERRDIRIPLLSDSGSSVIRAFGILNEAVPKNSPFHGIPNPATYVIDTDGVIQSVFAEENPDTRFTVGAVLSEAAPGFAGTEVHNNKLGLTASASDTTVRGGEHIRLFLKVKLMPRMHIYAPGVQGYIATDWKMAANGAAEAQPVVYPKARMLRLPAIDETVPVFEGELTLARDVVVKTAKDLTGVVDSGHVVLEGSFRYQACDDTKCYTPEDIPLQWRFRYEPQDLTRVPPELRRR
jgi:peroxiredoxin